MRAFEVHLNTKKLCLAGVGSDGILTAIASWVADRGELKLEVGGLILPSRDIVNWVGRDLRLGDEIRVKIVERDSVDKPMSRHRSNPAEDLRSQKKYVRRMAKQFGWKIQRA